MDRKSILLIDDDLSQLDLIELLFENKGYKVFQSISGKNALDRLAEEKITPDIIMVDLMMPQLSGAQTIAKIRELKVDCPIIAFTASEDSNMHDQAISAGCNLVITKPCKPIELVGEVEKLLAKAAAV